MIAKHVPMKSVAGRGDARRLHYDPDTSASRMLAQQTDRERFPPMTGILALSATPTTPQNSHMTSRRQLPTAPSAIVGYRADSLTGISR